MLSGPLFWIFVATCVILWYLNRYRSKRGFKEIPGPKGYPIVGNAFDVFGKHMHKVFTRWTEEYGPIYKVSLGVFDTVVISDPKMAKEIMSVDPNYAGRPHVAVFDLYEDEPLGILNSEGELWEVHRRFLLRQLRDFGFAKSAMEALILEELNEVIGKLKESEGKPIGDTKALMTLAVINSLWMVVAGRRFKHDDPNLMKLVTNTDKVTRDLIENGAIIAFMPWLRHIIPGLSGYTSIRKTLNENCAFFEAEVMEHKKAFDENNLKDFIDVYLAEVRKTADPNSVFYGRFAEKQLAATASDLFFAGSDTTSTTLSWAFLYLCKYPEVQKKFQEEIDYVTNSTRNVSVTDRPSMPYTIALIDEILRISSIVPNGVQHRAIAEKEFHGYWIQKDTWIMINMYHIHHSKEFWDDPDEFKPERFLSLDGKKYIKNENLIPFQIGRRQCVGETLARDTIFLYLTNIFQRFSVTFNPDEPEPTTETQLNFLLNPYPFSVVMKDRQANVA